MSDPALLESFRRQLRTVLAGQDPLAFLGLWLAWKGQDGISQDELIDVIKAEGAELPEL